MNEKAKPRESWLWKRKLVETLSRLDLSQAEASTKIGASPAALSQYLSERFERPTPEILAGIVKYFPEADAIGLLTEHLRDEVARTGIDPDRFTIAHYINTIYKATDIQAIQRAADASPGWSELIAALAPIARNDARHGYPAGRTMAAEIAKVAEPTPTPYVPPKKARKGKA